MLVLWYCFALSVGLELKATANRAASQQVLAPGDGAPLSRAVQRPAVVQQEHSSLQELSGRSALSEAHPLDRLQLLKYTLIAGVAVLLINYAHATYAHRKLRKTLVGLRFARRGQVERRELGPLNALQRLAQEPQVVVRHCGSEFIVHSSLKSADEILVGKASKGATRRREGCIIAQCCASIFGGLGGLIEILIPCVQLVPKGKKRDYVSKWMVAPSGGRAEPAYVFKHEDQDGNSIVVQDVRTGSAKMTLGAIDIDPCSWEAAVSPSPGKPLSIRGLHVTDREVCLQVQRAKETVAVITRGVTFKGFTHVKLAKMDTYVDFGEVTSDQEKLMILAAAVYMT